MADLEGNANSAKGIYKETHYMDYKARRVVLLEPLNPQGGKATICIRFDAQAIDPILKTATTQTVQAAVDAKDVLDAFARFDELKQAWANKKNSQIQVPGRNTNGLDLPH